MKKLLIAGAASVAMAAMPVVGVFAADPAPVIDSLTVNINGACDFDRAQSGDAGGTYEQTMTANDLETDFIGSNGVSKFVSACNNGTGYTVTLAATDLAYAHGANITYATGSGAALPTDPVAGSGTWVAKRTATTGGVVDPTYATEGNITNNATAFATTGADTAVQSSFSVKYIVSTHSVQEQGSYTGTATYTLAQNAAN